MTRRTLVALFGIAMLTVAGCGGGPALVEGTGRVTAADGAPVAGAAVNFVPTAEHGEQAVGVTDDQGRYSLLTRGNPGVVSGHYKVLVSKKQLVAGKSIPGADEAATQDASALTPNQKINRAKKKGSAKAKSEELLPKKYRDENATDIELDVPGGGSKELNITLTEK